MNVNERMYRLDRLEVAENIMTTEEVEENADSNKKLTFSPNVKQIAKDK